MYFYYTAAEEKYKGEVSMKATPRRITGEL
jgi:hypothetical protein